MKKKNKKTQLTRAYFEKTPAQIIEEFDRFCKDNFGDLSEEVLYQCALLDVPVLVLNDKNSFRVKASDGKLLQDIMWEAYLKIKAEREQIDCKNAGLL